MRWTAALLVAGLLTALAVSAGDSDCFASYSSGAYEVQECFICDGDHSATDCAELDLVTETGPGLPQFIQFDLANTTGCAGAVSVEVRGLERALGIPYIYGTLTTAGTSTIRVSQVRHRHLDADVDITTSAGCTDLEVIARTFRQRAPNP